MQRLQGVLPFNPAGQDAVSPDLAFNTSVSFVTNTNWQSYTPETTMSYLTQMAGLTVHNFVSAATGIALAVALVRGFARRSAQTIGNFWVDLTRCVLYILLPVAIVVAWCSSGRACRRTSAPIPRRPRWKAPSRSSPRARWLRRKSSRCWAPTAAASSTPTRRIRSRIPTALTNLIQMLLIFSLGAGLTNVFGRMVGSERQGWAIFAVMFVLFFAGVAVAYPAESQGNPAFAAFHVDQIAERHAVRRQHGRQGGPLRHRQLGAVHHHHHRCVLRRGQQHA